MKRIFILSALLMTGLSLAQVGVNTTDPKATLDIQSNSQAQVDGILIPRVNTARRNAFVNPENGLMIYNTDLKCYEINTGTPVEPGWQCLATAQNVQTISIEPLGFEGNFKYRTNNDPANHKVLFKVTNNTGSALTGIDLSYVRVDGTTQYIEKNQNNNVTIPANSSKVLEYGIGGGNWSTTSTFTLTYDQYSSASITLKPDRSNINDEVNNPSGEGTGDGGTATLDAMKKELFLVKDNPASGAIDKSLTISASSPLNVEISYTQGTGNYIAYESMPIGIQDAAGVQREIQLQYPEGNLDIGKGVIKATIVSVDGNDLKLPQTTLGQNKVIAQIPVKLNNTDKGTYDIIAFGGIPDKNFGDGQHDFVYMPVVSPTGRIWLNNNLGAEYSNINSGVFDPEKQAQSINDLNALGSRFQYRRAADGHELSRVENEQWINNQNITNQLSDNFTPNHADVIINPKSNIYPRQDRKYNWVNKSYLNNHRTEWVELWTLNGANNPCPAGYRPPSRAELEKEIEYLPQFSNFGLYESTLKFVGRYNYGGDYVWSYDRNGVVKANPSAVNMSANADQITNLIRCIKHE